MSLRKYYLSQDMFGYDVGVRFEKSKDTYFPTEVGGKISTVLKYILYYIIIMKLLDLGTGGVAIVSVQREIE